MISRGDRTGRPCFLLGKVYFTSDLPGPPNNLDYEPRSDTRKRTVRDAGKILLWVVLALFAACVVLKLLGV